MAKKAKTFDPLAQAKANPAKVKVIELNPAGARNAGKGWFDPLPAFPPEILACKNLVELEIFRGIADGTIPEAIGALTKLKSLGLGGLTTTQLPASIGKLVNLESLDLAYMELLTALPASIGKLTKLRDLQMPYSGLVALPPMGTLKALRTANFTNSDDLESVHPTLWQCAALETLHLPESVEELPPGIAKLTKLRVLSASPSALASIANELPKLKLTALHVHGKGELPETLAAMKTLKSLRANYNGYARLPALPDLVDLEVAGNQLATLIDVIPTLPKLKTLDYSGNPIAIAERREIDKLMKQPPSKRKVAPPKPIAKPKPKKSTKPALVGRVASVNASLSMIIADAKIAKAWNGTGDGTTDDLDGTDWDRARVALAKKDYAMLDVGAESAVALSLGVGQGIADVFRVGDRIVVVESIADNTEDELFLEFVASAPQKPRSVANLAVPSKKLVMVPTTDPGDSDESLALDVPAKISITIEAETRSSWGQARRMFITPA